MTGGDREEGRTVGGPSKPSSPKGLSGFAGPIRPLDKKFLVQLLYLLLQRVQPGFLARETQFFLVSPPLCFTLVFRCNRTNSGQPDGIPAPLTSPPLSSALTKFSGLMKNAKYQSKSGVTKVFLTPFVIPFLSLISIFIWFLSVYPTSIDIIK